MRCHRSVGCVWQARSATSSRGTAHVHVNIHLTVDKELNSAPHSEHGGALVDGRAVLELLGGHKTLRSKQTAHIIDKRLAAIQVEIDQAYLAAFEIVEHGAVVKVVGDPAALCQRDVNAEYVV